MRQSLRAGNTGHHVHRQRIDFLGAQGFDQSLVLARPQEADDGLTLRSKAAARVPDGALTL